MMAAVREFVTEFTQTHGPDRVHPAIQALDALTAVFGDVPQASTRRSPTTTR